MMRENELPTPCYVIHEDMVVHNLEILRRLQEETGARVLLAQKAFSFFPMYPLIGKYLAGTTASGLYEARLGKEKMPGGENHVYAPAFREDEFEELLTYADHIVFNSFKQVAKYGRHAREMGKSIGLRVNPMCSTQKDHAIYDPCSEGSRLGVTRQVWEKEAAPELVALLEGLHFHTLCEQDAGALAITLKAVEEQFGSSLLQMKWLNFGGGHHITKDGYNLGLLKECICHVQEEYGVRVYIEPGEAVAFGAGTLHTTVLEVVENQMQIAILDTSAACHMPDVIEMPYRPPVLGAGKPGELQYTCRLAGPTCLAGDIIGDYSFDEPLKEGQVLVFGDMAIYSMVKNNTFNGMRLPHIVWKRADGSYEIVKSFGYEDFKERLG